MTERTTLTSGKISQSCLSIDQTLSTGSITEFHIVWKTVKATRLLNFTTVIHICALLLRLLPFIHPWIIRNLRILVETTADTRKYVVNTTSADVQPHNRKHARPY